MAAGERVGDAAVGEVREEGGEEGGHGAGSGKGGGAAETNGDGGRYAEEFDCLRRLRRLRGLRRD